MRMNEAAEQLGLSQRAIKYYEKEGLLKVKRDENGYRNFDEHDLERLKKITLYRKLGIAVKDIENLLKTEDSARLWEILAQKRDQDVYKRQWWSLSIRTMCSPIRADSVTPASKMRRSSRRTCCWQRKTQASTAAGSISSIRKKWQRC